MALYHRLIWWYLAAPVILFLLGWYTPLIAVPVSCATMWAVWQVSRYPDASGAPAFPKRLTLLTLGFMVLLTWISMLRTNGDWLEHRAIFYDLARCHWPVGYQFDAKDVMLDYHLVYFSPSAWVASLIGMAWLPQAVFAWTSAGFGLIFWGYFRRSQTIAEWCVLCFFLIAFGGWDIFGYYLKHNAWPPEDTHVTWWSPLETSSNIILFYWVPQHVIPAWLAGLLLFRPQLKTQDRVRFGAFLLALVACWSPLVAIGLAVFVVIDFLSVNPFKAVLRHFFVYLVSVCLVGTYFVYIARDPASVVHGWSMLIGDKFLRYYVYFAVLQLAVIFAIVLLFVDKKKHQRNLLVCYVVLLLAPQYDLGVAYDLTMRGPMVEYFFLLLVTGDGALRWLRERNFGWLHVIAAGTLLLPASVAPLYDTWTALKHTKDGVLTPPFNEGIERIFADSGLKYQYIATVTPAKKMFLRNVTVCSK